MIGKLKRYSVREANGEKIVRVEIDITVSEANDEEVAGGGVRDFLEAKVGKHIAVSFGVLEEEQVDLTDLF